MFIIVINVIAFFIIKKCINFKIYIKNDLVNIHVTLIIKLLGNFRQKISYHVFICQGMYNNGLFQKNNCFTVFNV